MENPQINPAASPKGSAADGRRIALFGGTFDPIHQGHIGIASKAVDALGLDQVVFLPCRLSPHKSAPPLTSAAQRLEMIRLATRDLPWAAVDSFDLDAPPPSYSVRTAESFRDRFPSARLFWLMGADQWQALPAWKAPERLAELVDFIVFSRGGESPEARAGWQMHPITGDFPASATAIREAISRGDATPAWLDPAVAGLIKREGLYR